MGELTIKVKYLSDIKPLAFIDDKSDWIDLRAAEDILLRCGEYALIPLGVAMKLPDGYEAHIVPRSSTFKKYGILQVNSVGIVDSSYCGDNDQWFMPVYAVRDTAIVKNDRICQFRIVTKMAANDTINFETLDHLSDTDRGGFGSTGSV